MIGTDEFNRASLGWTVITGTPTIDNNQLLLDDGDWANYPIALIAPRGVVWFYICDVDDGDQLDSILGFYDTNNYLYARYIFPDVSAGDYTIELHKVVGGVDTKLKDQTGTGIFIPEGNACFSSGEITCWTDEDNFTMTSPSGAQVITACIGSLINKGKTVGFRCSAGQIRIDDFRLEEHEETIEACEPCDCSCEHKCVPATLTATIVVTVGECDLDGREIILTEDPNSVKIGLWNWSSDWETCVDGAYEYDIKYELECDQSGADSAKAFCLRINQGGGGVGPNSDAFYHLAPYDTGETGSLASSDAADSTCDPLSIQFSSFGPLSSQNECCGDPNPDPEPQFNIVITE